MAKFKKLGNTIAFKLTLIICLLIIPVNILVIFLSNSLVDGMQKRLMEYYGKTPREFRQDCQRK